MTTPTLRFVSQPDRLPEVPAEGRIALLDLAFAMKAAAFETETLRFIRGAGDRLALWLDHHEHEQWSRFANDPRFVLVEKSRARACPQLVTPEVVAAAGRVDLVLAHADLDGCLAAAKFLLGGRAPYPEADEDARFSDAPGHGFSSSPRGRRLGLAFAKAQSDLAPGAYLGFVHDVALSLVAGAESPELSKLIDQQAREQERREQHLLTELKAAVSPAPGILLFDPVRPISSSEKKFFLRTLEEQAPVAIVRESTGFLTLATFHDEGPQGLDLSSLGQVPGLEGLKGGRGYVWGAANTANVIAAVRRMLDRAGR